MTRLTWFDNTVKIQLRFLRDSCFEVKTFSNRSYFYSCFYNSQDPLYIICHDVASLGSSIWLTSRIGRRVMECTCFKAIKKNLSKKNAFKKCSMPADIAREVVTTQQRSVYTWNDGWFTSLCLHFRPSVLTRTFQQLKGMWWEGIFSS